jgi:hypothetical protein
MTLVIINRPRHTTTLYSVHNQSLPPGKRFIAQFKFEQDAKDFIAMAEARQAVSRAALNHGTLEELEQRFPQDFRNPEE